MPEDDVDVVEYHEGDGLILFEAFKKFDYSTDYANWGEMSARQQQNWEDVAKEFISKI